MKISIILTPRIGAIGKELAGSENMFFSDLKIIKKYFDIKAFARFQNIRPKVTKTCCLMFIVKFTNNLKFLGRYFKIVDKLSRFITDAIYIFSIYLKSPNSDVFFGYSSAIVSLIPFKKRIVFLHSYETFYFPSFFHSHYKNCSYIFCSKYLKNYFINKYKFINEENSTLLYNAVDKKIFYPIKQKKRIGNKIQLLFVSAWVKEKGLHILLESILKLPLKKREKFSLTIASSQNLWYEEKFNLDKIYLQKINYLLSKMPDVKLLGGVRHINMNKQYNKSDYLIFPSTWGEPCSLSLIESIFAGLPVIAFKVGGNQEILGKQNSILIDTKSSEALAGVLKKIINKNKYFKKPLTNKKNKEMSTEIRTPKLIKIIKKV